MFVCVYHRSALEQWSLHHTLERYCLSSLSLSSSSSALVAAAAEFSDSRVLHSPFFASRWSVLRFCDFCFFGNLFEA